MLGLGTSRAGRPKVMLELTEEERDQLMRRAKPSQALASRSWIVLACAEGLANKVYGV